MTDKKLCDCNEGRLPCSCKAVESFPAVVRYTTPHFPGMVFVDEAGFKHVLDLLGNLLAVIHRDGGHYQNANGLNKACSDAKDLVLEEREQLRLLKEAGELVDDHVSRQMDIATTNLEAADRRTRRLYELLGVTDLVQAEGRITKLLGEEAEAYALADQVRGLQELMAQKAEGKIAVSKEPLRQVLGALVGPAHLIRELQFTREPAELFKDNPINVLVAEFDAAETQPAEKGVDYDLCDGVCDD